MIKSVCVLAGGAGKRLWPASVDKMPKHFLPLAGQRSLLSAALDRAISFKPELIIIVTLEDQADQILAEAAGLDRLGVPVVVVPEPRGLNTAPALASASCILKALGLGKGPMLVLPADHLISPLEIFREDALKASDLAAQGFLVTFGIKPVRPETGYGYIEAGPARGPGFLTLAFREKPDKAKAEEYLRRGGFYWNSGMFVFTPERYMEELRAHSPEIARVFAGFPGKAEPPPAGFLGRWPEADRLKTVYADCPADSIDFAVMEKCKRTALVPAGFSWSDIGSWDEISSLIPEDPQGPPVFCAGAENNYVYSDIPVGLCGVKDLIVVVKNGALLICKKGESQKVKDLSGERGGANNTLL